MSGKGKRRREARRRAKQRQEEQRPAQRTQPEGGPERAAPPPREGRPPAREGAAHLRTAGKKARREAGLWQRVTSTRVSGWMIGLPVVVGGIVVVAVLILTSGSSGGTPTPQVTPDPRVAGKTPTATFNIEASDRGQGSSDSFYSPAEIRARAGDVIELVVKNTGTVSHNLRVSGPNKQFDVDISGNKGDDFEMPPNTILPGKTQRLVVKIDKPGTYPFRCDFHPQYQKGTLILK